MDLTDTSTLTAMVQGELKCDWVTVRIVLTASPKSLLFNLIV